ncbi:MAG TPA: ATP-binding protein [Burkholderiales bacterium]|nr:ATP-binding protein [Burkholderiales bacterium]
MPATPLLRVLHLEDDADDALQVRRFIHAQFGECEWLVAKHAQDFRRALDKEPLDLILSDSNVAGFASREALRLVRSHSTARLPFIFLTGTVKEAEAMQGVQEGADDVVSKNELWRLVPAFKRTAARKANTTQVQARARTLHQIVGAIRELSMARSIDQIAKIVRSAARDLVDADGATFVLSENGQCFYADEDAIGPLWKGHRFPQETCISGWAMMNRQQVLIEDIYADPRIPHDAYRPTFVKSLVMTPIRKESPVGAIGVYWAQQRLATEDEAELLQALADTTSVAMENIQVYRELECRVQDRTAQLQTALNELESFSYSVSHDLRAPLRSVRNFSALLRARGEDKLEPESKEDLDRIIRAADRMNSLIEDLLHLAKVTRTDVQPARVNMSKLAQEIVADLRLQHPERVVEAQIEPGIDAYGDAGLLRILLDNLLGNAWKYTQRRSPAKISFSTSKADGQRVFCIADNGAGFDMQYAERLFTPFHRLHSPNEFSGSGIGLATAHRVVTKHGGRIWAESAMNEGARFFFTLPSAPEIGNTAIG